MKDIKTINELRRRSKRGSETSKLELNQRIENLTNTGIVGMNNTTFVYSKLPEILSLIDNINKDISLIKELDITRDTIMINSYYSATIEGAKTTVNNVKRNFNNPKSKDEKMVVQSFKGLAYALDNGLDKYNVDMIWNLIVEDNCENLNIKGDPYRTGEVFVTDGLKYFEPPDYRLVEGLMEQLFKFKESNFNSLLKSIILHYYLVYIHPFCDGNGRFSRILMETVWYQSEYKDLVKVNISKEIYDNKKDYYKYLSRTDETFIMHDKLYQDITPFIYYMLYSINKAINTQINYIEKSLSKAQYDLLEVIRKNGRNRQVTVKSICKITKNDNESIVRYNLNKLVEHKFLSVSKDGKTNVYKLI